MPVSKCGPGASSGPGPYMIVRPRRVVARTRAHCSHARRREDAELVRSVRAHGGGGGVRSITSIERAGRLVAAPRPIPRSLSSEAAGVCQACVRHSLRCGLSVRDGRDRQTERVRERGVIFWQDVRTDGRRREAIGWVGVVGGDAAGEGGETHSNLSREPTAAVRATDEAAEAADDQTPFPDERRKSEGVINV